MQVVPHRAGLSPVFRSPPPDGGGIVVQITEEAGLTPPRSKTLRVELLVAEGDAVAQGAPVARLRDDPDVHLVAPMAARIGKIKLLPGRKLSEIVLFHEAGGDRHRHRVGGDGSEAVAVRLHQSGLWPIFQRRPFGGFPGSAERPAAIFVMAVDTRPLAPDPLSALEGAEEAFARGLKALTTLTDGPVFVCHAGRTAPFGTAGDIDRVRAVSVGARHPQGLAGFRIHDLAPATLDRPVWDCHAEDVAAIGEVLATGYLPETRLVHVAGEGLRRSRLVRTQPGADLRGLTHRDVQPGPHRLLSGSPLDGTPAHWLGMRDRQVSALPNPEGPRRRHWFVNALSRSALSPPVIPTKALSQAFGDALPAVAFVRAVMSGDEETAMKLGLLSFLEEDLALADFVLGGEAQLASTLTAMLDRIQREFAS